MANTWTDSPVSESQVQTAIASLNDNADFRAVVKATVDETIIFALQLTESGLAVNFAVTSEGISGPIPIEDLRKALQPRHFFIKAPREHWVKFFAAVPQRPYQSYWGMLRVLGKDAGIEVLGDVAALTKYARIWRIVLDHLRNAVNSTPASLPQDEDYVSEDEVDDDSLIGHYTWLTLPPLGKCKIFYEVSGQGSQPILFLHTAGADSRQYHSMMLNKTLQSTYKMYAFDLPGHGRSFPGQTQHPLSYANSEDFYITCIRAFLEKLKLHRAVVTGASMGGQICLAVALRATELSVKGVIPCEACAFIPSAAGSTIYNLQGDEGILNAERVCGMISPTSPPIYKRLNWWIYSSQASRIFPGDLKFYFDGWDGRDRMAMIDTKICPVYMLTGEYDYSCSVEMSRETAGMIRSGDRGENVVFEEMVGLGHFPFSEDPKRFWPYFMKALEFIADHNGK